MTRWITLTALLVSGCRLIRGTATAPTTPQPSDVPSTRPDLFTVARGCQLVPLKDDKGAPLGVLRVACPAIAGATYDDLYRAAIYEAGLVGIILECESFVAAAIVAPSPQVYWLHVMYLDQAKFL